MLKVQSVRILPEEFDILYTGFQTILDRCPFLPEIFYDTVSDLFSVLRNIADREGIPVDGRGRNRDKKTETAVSGRI